MALALLSLVIRIAYVFRYRDGRELGGDPWFYFNQAKLLADGKGLISPIKLAYLNRVEQAADHPPMFTLVLTLLRKVGITTPTGQMLANCVVGTVTVLLVVGFARRFTSDRAALLAGFLAAVNPNIFYFDGFLMSETWSMLGMVAAAWLLASALDYDTFDRAGVRRWGLAGVMLGLSSLVRAEYLFAVPIVGVYALARSWPKRQLKSGLLRAICYGLGALLAVSPWLAYNQHRFAKPIGLSIGFQAGLAVTNCEQTYYGDLTGYWLIDCIGPSDSRAIAEHLDQSEASRLWSADGIDYVKAHVSRVPQVVLIRLGRVLGLYHPLQQVNLDIFPEGRERVIAVSGLANWYLMAGLSAIGLASLRARRRNVFALVMPGLVVLVSVTVMFGSFRFRAAFEPMACILAAAGMQQLWQTARSIMAAPVGSPEALGPGHG